MVNNMENVILEVISNKKVGNDIYEMVLKGDLSSIKNPGEFVEIKLDGYYLRRPISVCDFSSNELKTDICVERSREDAARVYQHTRIGQQHSKA